MPHINHPNFGWSLTTEDLRRARNYKLFEIHNGHPSVNNLGGGVPGLEEVWDRLLTGGSMVYGMATDDAHVFKDPGNPMVLGPGRGWVMVRASRLEVGALMQSLERGDFYESTGVLLDDAIATDRSLAVKMKTAGVSKYRVQFIGRGGQILTEVTEPSATYSFRGDEGYVSRKGDREQRADGVGAARLSTESPIVGQRGMGGAPNHRRAGWLSCTGIPAAATDGVITISYLGERFCNRSTHGMCVFCSWAGIFERYITCSTPG